MNWTVDTARQVAEESLGQVSDRWLHVQSVAAATAELRAPNHVVCAAWLHDIGYVVMHHRTGMHALDGAAYLDLLGAPKEIVSLVAFHSGAEFEAIERGLIDQLLPYDPPEQSDFDLLTLADMTCGPAGDRVTAKERIDEILTRYEPQHPVHRAVTRSRDYLEECCRRASERTGYPM